MDRVQVAKQRILKSKLPLEEKARLMESYQKFEVGLNKILQEKNENKNLQENYQVKKKTLFRKYLDSKKKL